MRLPSIFESDEMVYLADVSAGRVERPKLWTPEIERASARNPVRFAENLRRMRGELGEVGAITAAGLYGLTLEKFLNVTSLPANGLESETAVFVLMVQDAHTPDFNAHNFRDDVTNEVSGAGYSAGGQVITSTEITLSSGLLTYDAADVAWASSTITSAMAAIGYFARGGASSADELIWLSDFVTAASTTNGTFTIQWHANGIFTIDYTP